MRHYLALLPELLVVVGGLVALARARLPERAVAFVPFVAFLCAAVAFALELWLGAELVAWARDTLTQDRFALFAKGAILLGLSLWVAASGWDETSDLRSLPLGFLAALGGMIAASAAVLPVLWLGLLLGVGAVTLPLALDPARRRGGPLVSAVLGLLVAGVGFALLGVTFHTWRLSTLATALPRTPTSVGGGVLAIVALSGTLLPVLALALAGRDEEAALAEPGARRGARTVASPLLVGLLAGPVVATCLVVAAKLAGGVFLAGSVWGPYLALLAVGVTLLGSIAALAARSVRGLAAWLVVGQTGWVLAGLAVHDRMGTGGALFLLGGLVVGGSVAPLLAAGLDGPRAVLAGLGHRQPARSLALSIALLSLAGAPPAAGFFGLVVVGEPLYTGGVPWLLAAVLLGVGLSTWAVLRVLLLIWIEGEGEERRRVVPAGWALGALLAAACLLAYCVFAYPIDGLAMQGAEALGLLH
ncbi:MAG: proton-conducting transporter membrane subunit [Candidatus Dormiibacterota bacterium]